MSRGLAARFVIKVASVPAAAKTSSVPTPLRRPSWAGASCGKGGRPCAYAAGGPLLEIKLLWWTLKSLNSGVRFHAASTVYRHRYRLRATNTIGRKRELIRHLSLMEGPATNSMLLKLRWPVSCIIPQNPQEKWSKNSAKTGGQGENQGGGNRGEIVSSTLGSPPIHPKHQENTFLDLQILTISGPALGQLFSQRAVLKWRLSKTKLSIMDRPGVCRWIFGSSGIGSKTAASLRSLGLMICMTHVKYQEGWSGGWF